VVLACGGRAVPPWWARQREGLQRIERLRVLEIPLDHAKALAGLCARNMRLHCTVQEGQYMFADASQSVVVVPQILHPH
jgi:uncharacterized protein YaeQ